MRLWSLHPRYLDAAGLVAVWREALLAQAVLRGKTRGYRHHPQLIRFRAHSSPRAMIAEYLRVIHRESVERGYDFSADRIGRSRIIPGARITVTRGQVDFEFQHLMDKLRKRDRERFDMLSRATRIKAHPLFRVVRGTREGWERGVASCVSPVANSRLHFGEC